VDIYIHFPIRLHSIVFNYLSTGINLLLRLYCIYIIGDARYCNWLRHYATSRKVASSIPDEVIGFFN
jgi:hypothetical protein